MGDEPDPDAAAAADELAAELAVLESEGQPEHVKGTELPSAELPEPEPVTAPDAIGG